MPVEPIHPNPHVVAALAALSNALDHLNMAGYPYAVGMRGVAEPYGMVQRAADRTLTHAFPDMDPEKIQHARVESGESYEHAVRALRRERAERRDADISRELEMDTGAGDLDEHLGGNF